MPAAVEETNTSSNGDAVAKNENTEQDEESNEKPNRDQQIWEVLKAYILRDRARKKQEREAEVEEERLRKEREAREQQDVMTLGETREEIVHLETKLQLFKEEKHQLFLQLKRVLNEDDNRRRRLQKVSEQQMAQIQTLPQGMVSHQPQSLYIQPQPQTAARLQPLSQQPPLTLASAVYKTAVKRPRSPSPPQAPVTMYHQGYTPYKPVTVAATSYQGSPQKTPQYSSQPSAFYPVAPQDISIYYSGLSRDAGRPVYDQQRPQGFPIEHKLPEHYTTLRTAPTQHGHIIHAGPGLSINPTQAPPKGGSITAGYPVRSQPQYQQAAPASLYTAQSRQIYQNYPQRD